jgi:hypothetical protein
MKRGWCSGYCGFACPRCRSRQHSKHVLARVTYAPYGRTYYYAVACRKCGRYYSPSRVRNVP